MLIARWKIGAKFGQSGFTQLNVKANVVERIIQCTEFLQINRDWR